MPKGVCKMNPTASTWASVIVLTGLLYLTIFHVAFLFAKERGGEEDGDVW